MGREEMRFLRREIINIIIHKIHFGMFYGSLRYSVRLEERERFGYELQAYKMFP